MDDSQVFQVNMATQLESHVTSDCGSLVTGHPRTWVEHKYLRRDMPLITCPFSYWRPTSMRSAPPPSVIYLPSSGGHTGSRITPEVSYLLDKPDATYLIQSSLLPAGDFHFVATAFRKTEVWLSGLDTRTEMSESLPLRDRFLVLNVSSSVHPRPYTKPAVRFSSPPWRGASLEPEPTSVHPSSSSNPTPTVEVLKTLVPALIPDPSSFEESISSICAAHDIDKSIASAVTQAARRRSNRFIER